MADAKTERCCAGGVAYTLTRRRVRNLNLRSMGRAQGKRYYMEARRIMP